MSGPLWLKILSFCEVYFVSFDSNNQRTPLCKGQFLVDFSYRQPKNRFFFQKLGCKNVTHGGSGVLQSLR